MSNQLIENAQKCHKEGNFDQMCSIMQQIISSNPSLNLEQRNMLWIAYKGAATKRRAELKQNPNNTNASRELEKYCAEFINLVSQTLLPKASDNEAQVFFYKCMGDFYRYYDEVQPNQTNKSSALNCYENACHIGSSLDPTNPLLLNVALNHGVCCTEQMNDMRRGLEITEKAIDAARPRLQSLDERKKQEASFVLTLLFDNVKLWRKDLNMPEPKPIEGLVVPPPPQQQQGNAPQQQQQQQQQQKLHQGYAPQQQFGQYASQPQYGR